MARLVLGAVAILAVTGQKAYIVMHHKSGTHAARTITTPWCCDATGNKSGVVRWSEADCLEQCAARGVHMFSNGLHSSKQDNQLHASPRGSTVLHFVRNPIDMIVSGYLYHRACQEPWWTDNWDHKNWPLFIPPDPVMASVRYALGGAFNQSYCQLLQSAPPELGIRAEILRTLNAVDGVGNMLRNIGLFVTDAKLNHVEACMADINPLTNDAYLSGYEKIVSRLPVDNATAAAMLLAVQRDFTRHSNRLGTSIDESFIMRSLWTVAARVASREARAMHITDEFTNLARRCSSEYCAIGAEDTLMGIDDTCIGP